MQLRANETTTFSVPQYSVLTITTPAGATAALVHQNASAGAPDLETTNIAAGTTVQRGPFNRATRWKLTSAPGSIGSITYEIEAADLRQVAADVIAETFATLPTSDPGVAGALWVSNGAVRVSAG